MSSFKLKGAKELRAALVALGGIEGAKVIRSALRAGMKPVLADTRALVSAESRDSGAFAAALGISTSGARSIAKSRGLIGRAQVVARGSNKKALAIYNANRIATGRQPVRSLYHFLLVDEYGYHGRPGKHLMARALEQNRNRALRATRGGMQKGLEKLWRSRTSARA